MAWNIFQGNPRRRLKIKNVWMNFKAGRSVLIPAHRCTSCGKMLACTSASGSECHAVCFVLCTKTQKKFPYLLVFFLFFCLSLFWESWVRYVRSSCLKTSRCVWLGSLHCMLFWVFLPEWIRRRKKRFFVAEIKCYITKLTNEKEIRRHRTITIDA